MEKILVSNQKMSFDKLKDVEEYIYQKWKTIKINSLSPHLTYI